jgi:hypothetical protein
LAECAKCGGEIREGEAFVRVTTFSSVIGGSSSGFGIISIPGFDMPTSGRTSEENMLWREKTGAKTGLLIKSEEQKTMKIFGRRCVRCGYIELYGRE